MAKERERDRDSGHNSINSEIKRTGEDRDRQQNRVIQRTLKRKKKTLYERKQERKLSFVLKFRKIINIEAKTR